MIKYDIIVKILDQIAKESPSKYKVYYPTNTDIEAVNSARSRAFIHFYMKVKFGILDFDTREKFVSDGPNDGGIDAYYIDCCQSAKWDTF